jgi:hypothetical protein
MVRLEQAAAAAEPPADAPTEAPPVPRAPGVVKAVTGLVTRAVQAALPERVRRRRPQARQARGLRPAPAEEGSVPVEMGAGEPLGEEATQRYVKALGIPRSRVEELMEHMDMPVDAEREEPHA